jgi:hypothetical protein
MPGTPTPAAAPACTNCGESLQLLTLAGHYGRTVEIDLCGPCHLVWFDSIEQARLAGPGLLDLVGAMAAAHALAHRTLQPSLACLQCRGPVHAVHNRTRWGQSVQLECLQRHGAWQTFGQFLGERGLLRPMSSADRARALARDGALHCVNCGGALGQTDTQCPWCEAAPALVDVARLAHALDPEGATQAHAVHHIATTATALSCAACGAAQAADAGWQCQQCGATLTAPGLAEAHRQVLALGPALRAHADKPSPDIVRQRLAAQEPALQRQRDRTAQLQAEADAQQQANWGPRDDGPEWQLPDTWQRALPWAAAALAAAWWWWGS